MRLRFGALLAVSICSSAFGQDSGKAFELQIGEQRFGIDADDGIEITLPDGTKTRATLMRNQFATFVTDKFSFAHPGNLSVSRSDLGNGVVQYLMATAVGSMVIVQSYDDLDPSKLTSMMLRRLTEDSVAAGGNVEEKPATKLVDGKTLNGLAGVETLKDDVIALEVYAYSKGSSGLIIITRLDDEYTTEDGAKLAKFWQTLKLK